MTGSGDARVLAHVTQSRMRAPLDDPVMARFAFVFDAVLQTARGSAGFVWQLETHERGHPVVTQDDPLCVVSVSMWQDYAALHSFVYRSSHGQALLHRQEWFRPVAQPSTALWWSAADEPPGLDDAVARLTYLRRHGPSPLAFTLTRRFDPAGRPDGPAPPRRRR